MMNCKNIIMTAGTLLACFCLNANAQEQAPPLRQAQGRPNVLLIAIDDLNDWIGCMGGHPQAQTPHMDRLAARGVLFDNAHCQSPVCNPSRASMMTSLYPSTSGVYFLNPDLDQSPVAKKNTLMPKRFQNEGYYVTGAGKLFHGSQNKKYLPNYAGGFGGFGPFPKKKISPFPGMKLWDWGVFPEQDDLMPDYKIAAWGVEQLGKSYDKPLFLATGFYTPHVPQYAPQKWFDMYPMETLQLPKVVANDLKDISEYGINITRLLHVAPTMEWVEKNDEWKPLVQSYLACISFTDHQIGKLLDALDASPYKDNTYIVLYTDHGFHQGEKERFAKRSLWEDGTRTPMIIAGPGIVKGKVCSKPAQLLDIYPTLLELTGLKADPKHDGNSLVPLLKNPQADWPHMARTSFGPGNYSIVSEEYRYIHYNDGSEEFYDRTKDTHEWHNVITNPEYAAVIKLHRDQVPQERHEILGKGSTGHKSFEASEAARPLVVADDAETIIRQGEPYVLTPNSTEVYPSAITQKSGEIDTPESMLKADEKAAVLRYPKGGKRPFIILDLGRASASGYPVFNVTARKGTPVVRLAYATHPKACGEKGGFGRGTCRYLGKEVDLPVLPANPGRYELFSIPRNGTFVSPLLQGQQRYVRVQLDTPGTEVAIDSLHILNKDVHDIAPTAGHFLCNDETINQIWYASAWTLQIASFPHHNAWTTLNGWLAPRKLEHANDVALSSKGVAWRDYSFEFDFEIRTNPYHGSHAGWAIRCRDANNGYVAAIDLAGNFTLQKRSNGRYTTLKSTALKSKILDGEQHHIKVDVQGSTITTWLNGQQIDVTTDESYASGRVGFWHPKEKWFLVDNVKVTDPKGKVLLQDYFSGELDQWSFARTLAFIADGAKRDRLVWSGDLDWAARNVYYAFRDVSYMRDSLKMLAFNQTPEGFVHAAPYPENTVPPASGDYGHFASDEFSAWLVPVAWDYLLYTADTSTLREIYPAIVNDLRYLLKYVGKGGLFHQRRETSKRAGNLKLGDTGARTYMNVLLQDALHKGARVAAALGENDDSVEFQGRADALRTAIQEQLWDADRGYFVESLKKRQFELTGNALAMAVGFVSPEQAERIVPHFKRHQHGKFQSLMIRGLFEYGFGDAAVAAFFAHGWPELVNTREVPLTTTECMTLKRGGWGDESHPDTAMAHLFTGYILGVEPTTLAYEHFTVKPVMCRKINRAKGIVPTPKGDIVTSWKREEKKFTHHLVSPEGTRVTIALPVAGLAKYEVLVNGQRPEDGIKGVGSVDSDGQYLYLRDATPGSYSSIVTVQEGTYAEDENRSGSKNQGGEMRKSRVKAASSHEQGNWGLSKLMDGITTSKKKSKGYSSTASQSADIHTWLEIDLRDQKAIKKITLYPRPDAALSNGRSVGFPVDMKILVKKAGGSYSIAKTLTNIPNPQGKPYEIDLYTVVGFPEANSIRIEVTKRGLPAADEPDAYRLQLAELKVKFVE